MKNFYFLLNNCHIKLLVLLMVWQHTHLHAQQSGSTETINGYMAIASGCTHASASETLYIGPGTYVVNGTWQVYSKNIWISPNAVISGSGTIRLYNPSVAGGTASSSLLDGNNSSNFIGSNMGLNNASDMTLTDLSLPADLTAAGWTTTASNASLSLAGDFNFAVANGDALLGSYDMTLSNTGTLSGYREDRFVVTASTGHLVKQNYTGAFIYPVGMAAGDYTPAQISNTIANTMHVNVTNYAGMISATFAGAIAGTDGINRAWNIYADNGTGNSTINLEHNDSTERATYNDAFCFVTRFTGATPTTEGDNFAYSYWESNTQAAGTGTGSLTTGAVITTASERSRAYTSFATSASAYRAWYSKASDLMYPLPVSLMSFSGKVTECGKVNIAWQTAQERDLAGYEMEQSSDGISFMKLATVPAQLSSTGDYNFTAFQNNGTSYYRLKIKERNGKISYSKLIAVKMSCAISAIQVFPSPFSNSLTITSSQDEIKSLQVFDLTGRAVRCNYTGQGKTLYLNGAGLVPGVYLIRVIKANGSTEDVKAIKK